MKKITAAALLLATFGRLSFGAAVESIKCERDQRPVDGAYTSVELVKNDAGKYDVYYQLITPGFGSPVKETRVKIARNLAPCAFAIDDGRLASCHKLEREEGEKTNTGFSTKLVTETQVVDDRGNTKTATFIDVTVYSPLLMQGGENFPRMERKGWFTTRFSGTNHNGIMMNRCLVK